MGPRQAVKVVTLGLFVSQSKEKNLKLVRKKRMGKMTLKFVSIEKTKDIYSFLCMIRNEHLVMIFLNNNTACKFYIQILTLMKLGLSYYFPMGKSLSLWKFSVISYL